MSKKPEIRTPAAPGVMQKITGFFTELMRKYLPDPFVFAIGLTLLTFVLAFAIQHQSPIDAVVNWGNGFWDLLAFTTQMAVILAAGFVLANSPVVDRCLIGSSPMCTRPKRPSWWPHWSEASGPT